MVENPEKFTSITGVLGLCVHLDERILWKKLPATVTDVAAAELCATISRTFSLYENSERQPRQIFLEKAGQCVYTFRLQPGSGERVFLTFILSDRAAVAEITRLTSEFCQTTAADWEAQASA